MRKLVFIIVAFVIMAGAVTNVFGDGHRRDTHIFYEEICASKGDSYWSIAQRYDSDGMSKKRYMEYIMNFNGTDNEKLFAGQKIIVPIIEYV